MVIFLHLGIGPDIKHLIFNQLAPNTSEKVPETFPPPKFTAWPQLSR